LKLKKKANETQDTAIQIDNMSKIAAKKVLTQKGKDFCKTL